MPNQLFDEADVSTELATVEPQSMTEGQQLMAIFQEAVQRDDFDAAKMQAIMDMKRAWDRDRAAEAYAGALTAFQSRCPVISKVREAKIVGTRASYSYKFASYEDIMRQIGPLLTDCGLVPSFSTTNQEKGIRVTLKIRHGTHVEDHTLDVPIPAMNVNDAQRYGAALSYAKRYALCAALNIVLADEDDDTQSLDTITDEQARVLEAFIDEHDLGGRKPGFLKWLDVTAIENIPAHRFDDALTELRRASQQRRQP